MSAFFLPADTGIQTHDEIKPAVGLAMTPLSDKLNETIPYLFSPINLSNGLGETISKAGKSQLRLAETEKYAHVTFFFNGGIETAFKGEIRELIESPKVSTYDMQPEMSAGALLKSALKAIKNRTVDVIIINFANPDMVGHTGNFNAAIKACEVVDECSNRIIKESLNNNYSIMIIADHGNSDIMKNDDGSPNTAHTTNPVPIIIIDEDVHKINNGILADIAPTILNIMGIEQPKLMTGNILI